MTTTPEAYVHLSADETILTFYYDTLRTERDGTTWGIRARKAVNRPCWAGDSESPNTTILTAVFDASFRDFRPTTTEGWFYYFQSLKSIEGLEHLNTSRVTDMSQMFSGCESLTSLDLSSFDTSKVTIMGGMFSGCESLTSLDLASFNTSKVWLMSGMFRNCSSLTALDLSSFDTSKVTSMGGMFENCKSLTSLDLSSFDTSEVWSMSCMFWGCISLTALDLSNFDTYEVTNTEGMFYWCKSLTTLNISHFATYEEVMWMSEMFSGCSSLTTIYCNSSWCCRHSDDMFTGCDSLKGAMAYDEGYWYDSMANPVTGYFTKKVLAQENEAYVVFSLDMKRLTFYCDKEREYRFGTIWGIEETILQNDQRTPAWLSGEVASKEKITKIVIDESFQNFVPKTTAGWFEGLTTLEEICGLDNLNTSEVTDMSRMFAGCGALRSLDVSRFDTLNVKQMQQMFMGCAALTELDLYFFDTANVTDMHEMFKDCKGLTTLDLQSFNTAQVTDMHEMFLGCAALSALNLAHFDTAQVTDLHAMFKGCKGLTTLDLSNFQTSEVKDMREMFSGCSALTTIWSFAFRNCFASEAMFYECTSLQGATNFNEKYTDARMANPERGYFSRR